MGRPKKFNREEVLEKAMPLFWDRGYADTGLQDLERVTGVNKSGLYSEFKDKEEIFLASLKHYYSTRRSRDFLLREPFGWQNIEKYFQNVAQGCNGDRKGCFGVNSMRELHTLPTEAQAMMLESRASLKRLFTKNIANENPKRPPEAIAEVLSTFFSGLNIEQNMKTTRASQLRKIEDFINAVRHL